MPCEDGHVWTLYHDYEPEKGAPCDCGLKKWGVPLTVVREHEWQWYMNGMFCRRCNEPIGTKGPCRD